MNSLISICIPTYHRPDLLRLAVQSCLEQRHRPIEILIGDDSTDFESSNLAASLKMPEGVTLRYEHNRPQLGQAANVNRLFSRARGDRLMILHDDDLLCPNGLDTLVEAWDANEGARCVYGVQKLIDATGNPITTETRAWNERYFRVSEEAGAQKSALVAAIWQQVPNDCYLIGTELAQRIGYRMEAEVGQAVDAEFVIRASRDCAAGSFIFVNEPVSLYRLTPMSIARAQDLNRRQDLFYQVVEQVKGDHAVTDAKRILLARISVGAALDAAMKGRRRQALSIIFSRHYSKPYLSLTTFYRLACVLSPRLGATVKAKIRRTGPPPQLRESTLI